MTICSYLLNNPNKRYDQLSDYSSFSPYMKEMDSQQLAALDLAIPHSPKPEFNDPIFSDPLDTLAKRIFVKLGSAHVVDLSAIRKIEKALNQFTEQGDRRAIYALFVACTVNNQYTPSADAYSVTRVIPAMVVAFILDPRCPIKDGALLVQNYLKWNFANYLPRAVNNNHNVRYSCAFKYEVKQIETDAEIVWVTHGGGAAFQKLWLNQTLVTGYLNDKRSGKYNEVSIKEFEWNRLNASRRTSGIYVSYTPGMSSEEEIDTRFASWSYFYATRGVCDCKVSRHCRGAPIDVPAILNFQLPKDELFFTEKGQSKEGSEYFVPDQARHTILQTTIQFLNWSLEDHSNCLKARVQYFNGENPKDCIPSLMKALDLDGDKSLEKRLSKRYQPSHFTSQAKNDFFCLEQKIPVEGLEFADLFYQGEKAPDYARDFFQELLSPMARQCRKNLT
jgi:hypothetical protein